MIVGFGHLGVYDLGVFKVCRKLYINSVCLMVLIVGWLVCWFGLAGLVCRKVSKTHVFLYVFRLYVVGFMVLGFGFSWLRFI